MKKPVKAKHLYLLICFDNINEQEMFLAGDASPSYYPDCVFTSVATAQEWAHENGYNALVVKAIPVSSNVPLSSRNEWRKIEP